MMHQERIEDRPTDEHAREYYCQLGPPAEEPEELEAHHAAAPIRAARLFSMKHELKKGTVVQVKVGGGKGAKRRFRNYIVGDHPRSISTLGPSYGGVHIP